MHDQLPDRAVRTQTDAGDARGTGRLTRWIGVEFEIVQVLTRIPFAILREVNRQDAMSGGLQGVHDLMTGDDRHFMFDRAPTE
jgi:hypothetical protein